jgi:hypothetical protein
MGWRRVARRRAARRRRRGRASPAERCVGAGRAQGAVLVRPDVADAEVRQARQVALHGHAARAALCRRGRCRGWCGGGAGVERIDAGPAGARAAAGERRDARGRRRGRGGRHRAAQRARREHRAGPHRRFRRARLCPCARRRGGRRCAAGRCAEPGVAGRAAGVPRGEGDRRCRARPGRAPAPAVAGHAGGDGRSHRALGPGARPADHRRPGRRRHQRVDGARRHDRRTGHDPGPHQRPGHGVARGRPARGAGGDDPARPDGRGPLSGVARRGRQGPRRRDPARGQPRDPHAARSHRAAQPGPAPEGGPVRPGQPARAAARRAGGAGRGRDPHRQAHAGLSVGTTRALSPGRGRDRRSGRRPHRHPQWAECGPAGRGLGPVPARLGSQPAGRAGARCGVGGIGRCPRGASAVDPSTHTGHAAASAGASGAAR